MFQLPALPYAYDALEPTISAETLRLHHDKHQAKYFETTNALCEAEKLQPASLEDLIIHAERTDKAKLAHNAGQAWNHTFFWTCMRPGQTPRDGVAAATTKAFGDLAGLKKAFVEAGEAHFASGWVWLIATSSGLKVVATHDAGNHVSHAEVIPLLACDLWEHAYYLDYKNDRKAFLESWFDTLPDWSFAAHQLSAAEGGGQAWRHPEPQDAPLRRQA